MDVYYAYNYGSAGWLIVQAIPLLTSPTMMITLLSPEVRETTALEAYLCRSLGMGVITIGLLLVLLTGSIPLTTSFSDPDISGLDDPRAPYAIPTLIISTIYQSAVAFFCYIMWNEVGNFPYVIATVVNSGLAAVGVWCVLFASENGRISKKTGADKRTSSYPFKNVEAEKKKAGKRA